MTGDSARDLEHALREALRSLSPDGGAGRPRGAEAAAAWDEVRGRGAPFGGASGLTVGRAADLFDAQARSRHIDLAARHLRASGAAFYTIGSSGHEGNAAVAAATRTTDPALLHYRSGAFYLTRAAQVPGIDGVRDILLGVVASRDEPMAGGRHKVFGRKELAISPQTSTIASHLPRAVGLAFAIEHARKLHLMSATPDDAIVVCSFGDASINHSTAVGALNSASHAAHRGVRLPILFVVEDNGLGISVPTPAGWIARAIASRPGVTVFEADGCELAEACAAARAAVEHVRARRRPAILHLRVVRLLGHAGSDVELAYRSAAAIRADEARDPVRLTALRLVEAGVPPELVLARYEALGSEVASCAGTCSERPRLRDALDVMGPLAPRTPDAVAAEVARGREAREGADEPEPSAISFTLGESIRSTLAELLSAYPEVLVFGEDVGAKGGAYGVTRGLARRFGAARVFDTLLDEQTILGLALGAAQHGFLPIPEIQYLAYLHNAEDQLRGEAATLKFFSQGQYQNPMVIRVAAFAYQLGFGGHFHNDHSVAVLRDIPGLVIAAPSRAADAAAMLRTCVAAGRVDGSVSVFLEPIALYHRRDLFEPGDREMLDGPEGSSAHVPIGSARVYGDGRDLLIVSFANGIPMSRRVAQRLSAGPSGRAIHARVLDLRWIAPLPVEEILAHANECGRVLIVDETRSTGGVSEGVMAALVDAGFDGRIRRVASQDSLVPLGPAANLVLVDEASIEAAARDLMR